MRPTDQQGEANITQDLEQKERVCVWVSVRERESMCQAA